MSEADISAQRVQLNYALSRIKGVQTRIRDGEILITPPYAGKPFFTKLMSEMEIFPEWTFMVNRNVQIIVYHESLKKR